MIAPPLSDRSGACFFAGRPGAGPCDGRLVRAHLIPKQVIRRTLSRRLERTLRDAILWDPRVLVAMCGGATGCSGHHGMLDYSRKLRIARAELPPAVEEFAADHGLSWWLWRTYGPPSADQAA